MEKHPFEPGVDQVSATNRQRWRRERELRWELDAIRHDPDLEQRERIEAAHDFRSRILALQNEILMVIRQEFAAVQSLAPKNATGASPLPLVTVPDEELVQDTFSHQMKLMYRFCEDEELMLEADLALAPSWRQRLAARLGAGPALGLEDAVALAAKAAPFGHTRVRLLVELEWLDRYKQAITVPDEELPANPRLHLESLRENHVQMQYIEIGQRARMNYCIRDRMDECGYHPFNRNAVASALKDFQQERKETARWLATLRQSQASLFSAVRSWFTKTKEGTPEPLALMPVLQRWSPPRA